MTTFRKHRPNPPHGFFRAEAAGLAWLADAGGVRVARVVDVGDDAIELERLTAVTPTAAAGARFGADLARTHDAGAASFGCPPPGWDGPGYIGDAPLPYADEPTWGRFYADARGRPYLDDAGLAPGQHATLVRLADALAAGRLDDTAPPARLHGDLWSGNVLYAATDAGASEVALIDPAAHGGHRVTDLAMLALFGTPHLATILAAYEATSTHLPANWRELVPLHQVHPLLVHAVLFRGGYGARAAHAAERALALLDRRGQAGRPPT